MSDLTNEAYDRIMDGCAKPGDVCIQHVTEFHANLPLWQYIKRARYTQSGNVRKLGYVYSDNLSDIWFLSKKDALSFSRI